MMSPSVALHDQIFLTWLAIVPATFIAAGVILVLVQFGLKKDLGGIWDTYRSWWIMGIIALAAVFLGRIAIVIGVASLALLAFYELVRASPLNNDPILACVGGGGIALFILSSLFPQASGLIIRDGFFQSLSLIAALAMFLALFFGGRWRLTVLRCSLVLIGSFLLGIMFGQLAFLTNFDQGYGLICYVIFATELNDVAAFTFGRIFGRRLLCPSISPRKTWEGAIGAVLTSLALPWLVRFSLPTFGPLQLVLAGLIVGVGGQIGDLMISAIKRKLNTKDMGSAIPGHGGILDRIDSLICVVPLFIQLAVH